MLPCSSSVQDARLCGLIDVSTAELRQRINAGELLKTGDRVAIVTFDGKAHRFAIKSIDAGLIYGRSLPLTWPSPIEATG